MFFSFFCYRDKIGNEQLVDSRGLIVLLKGTLAGFKLKVCLCIRSLNDDDGGFHIRRDQ